MFPFLAPLVPEWEKGGRELFKLHESQVPSPPRFKLADGRPWDMTSAVSKEAAGIPGARISYADIQAILDAGKVPTPWQLRLFLVCMLRVNGEFTGNGYTQNPDGSPGSTEFFAPNVPMADVFAAGGVLVDLRDCMDLPAELLEGGPSS